MQTKDIVNWLKMFIISFAVVAIGRSWFEQFAFGGVKSYASVALFAGILAVAIATVQIVLAPRPIPDMKARPAAAVYATPSPPIAPSMPVYKTSPPKRKKKAKKRK